MSGVIVCGLYRSGTTYLQTLIDANLSVPRARGYKHAMCEDEMVGFDADASVILVSKALPKWVNSLARQSYDLCDFYNVLYEHGHTAIELPYDDPDRPMTQGYTITGSVEKLCSLYRQWHTHWAASSVQPVIYIAYEKLLFEPERELHSVAKKLGVQPASVFINYAKVSGSRQFTLVQLEEYADLDYLPCLSGVQVDVIRKLS